MLDFTNAPAHLISPLSVDTNIEYSLDMSKFPGLNEAESMKQLTLLPCSNEGPRVCTMCGNYIPFEVDSSVPCGFCVYYGLVDDESETEDEPTDELFTLIASCDIDTEFDIETTHPGSNVQSVFEDIINSTCCKESGFSELPKLSPLSSRPSVTDLDSFLSTSCEFNCEQEVPYCEETKNNTSCDTFGQSVCVLDDLDNLLYSPAKIDNSSNKKRKIADDEEHVGKQLYKRHKIDNDMEDILLNCFGDFSHLNPVCATERVDAMSRFS